MSIADSRIYAEKILKTYFKTFSYPYTHHQINSYDQFVANDISAIVKASNPILLLIQHKENKNKDDFDYKIEIFIGGLNGSELFIGTPTLSLKENSDIRILYPNEARLRNLTYSSIVEANILVRLTFKMLNEDGNYQLHTLTLDPNDPKYSYLNRLPIFKLPIMLHSRYCLLHDKPNVFLKEVGECPYDYGGYFIIDGAEKVLITRQEQAFNTFYIMKQNDPNIELYGSIQCLNPKTRQVKRMAFLFVRDKNTIEVNIPFVRKPIPLFILFRALGVQSDEDILRLIFPNVNDFEYKTLGPLLHESILAASPFLDTHSAIQYIKLLTKGFSEAHVYDIIVNQLFIHVDNKPMNKPIFLAECVRKMLRVKGGFETSTDKDDIRNQRCLTSGFLIRMLFQNSYTKWLKGISRAIDYEFNFNPTGYTGSKFLNMFSAGSINNIFLLGYLTDGINRGFKGKWSSGVGEEKTGVLQPLSRLSYLDFLSHCRRVVLDFDTGMKLQGPRRLHTTQFGYFCTSETPSGSSIGITKNLSILTAISISMEPTMFIEWLYKKMDIIESNNLTPLMMKVAVPVYVNSGIIGFSMRPNKLIEVCKLLKHTGCLPAYSSITFNIRQRSIAFYFDEGRPVRPLVHLDKGEYPFGEIQKTMTWKEMVMGTYPKTQMLEIPSSVFFDPLEKEKPTYEEYISLLKPFKGIIEYVDPYEANEAFIAMYPDVLEKETTHVEVHPSTMLGLLTSIIPFPNHNQSPRNQLSCSQSKQGISVYSTNYMNRYDNQTHILCYGEAPLVRSLYYDYMADGQIGYGHNLVLAMGCFTGYNQEDGIIFNADSFNRGMFRNMTFRSYEAFEEDDTKSHTKTRIANPISIPSWTDLKPGIDYRKLDERGIIKVGEYVDEDTVLISRYIQMEGGPMKDASITAQVWTSGTVQEVVVTVNNKGLALVKVRIIQDRVPELGDKFCLTDDHDVLTKERGWVAINNLTLDDKVAQLNKETGSMEYVNPKELFVFDHEGDMYEVESQGLSLKTTLNHRMYVRENENDTYHLIEAKDILTKNVYYKGMNTEVFIESGKGKITNYKGKVYCVSVPSEVFLVRRNGKIVYTGNSNRHGQKGTIGMLIKGVDMPRTANGLVPDMIMNPHAIPSRMTIAQLLESLLGKTACLAGFIGDATAFMNQGGIENSIGDVLSNQYGMNRHGEEILYDGTTGAMIPSTIFMGNVYTMRLKHMVEDKWNARGEGRKEQKTRQPTGGRGNQGGLRIGEMDRDAMLGHGISEFIRESYMKRSDGYTFYVCNGCGTVPISNEKINFFICPLCDGPVQFIGDSAKNFELLPTMKRSSTSFSKIAIPYSVEVLNKELNTYLNIYLRYLTTKDVTHIRRAKPQELTAQEIKDLLYTELEPRELKDLTSPEMYQPAPVSTVDEEQLALLGVESKKEENEEKDDEDDESLPIMSIESAKKSIDNYVKSENENNEEALELDEGDFDDISVLESVVQSPSQPVLQNYVLMPVSSIIQSQIPNAPPTIAVDTTAQGNPLKSILRRPNSPSRFRGTMKAKSAKPSFSINKLEEDTNSSSDNVTEASNVPYNTKVTIVKEE